MQLKPNIGDLAAENVNGRKEFIVARGVLCTSGPSRWKSRQWQLTIGDMMSYNCEICMWESLKIAGCAVFIRPKCEHKHGEAFELKFPDGRSIVFVAPYGEAEHWCAALESVCRRPLVPVQLVTVQPNLIRVETGPVCLIKQHLISTGTSFIDRTEAPVRKREGDIEQPERALQYRKSNSPRVAICVIDDAYFDDHECLLDFEAYTSGLLGHVELMPVLVPGFNLPARGQVWPWWPQKKRRWQDWEKYPLFVDLRSKEQEQENVVRGVLLPSLRGLLRNWHAQPLLHKADDEITCTGCRRRGLASPMKVRRSVLEAHLLRWQKEEMRRRVSGAAELEPLYPCEFCGGVSTASELLSTRASRDRHPGVAL